MACALQHTSWCLSQHPLRQSSQHLLQPHGLTTVYAITSRVFTGVTGSSLVMTSSHALGHFSVALYRISTVRHDPGCSVAGNGLFTSFQCLLFRLNATLVTCSLQSPTLQIAIVRSPRQHAFTPPMQVEPVTASFPAGAFPKKATLFAPVGSSLVTVAVPDFAPKLAG